MRWSIIRLIWLRELRDQLRDRRTIFMIAVLPLFLYPVGGVGLMTLAQGISKRPTVVEVQGADNLPPPSPAPAASLFALSPPPPGVPLAGLERAAAAAALYKNRTGGAAPLDYPPLLVKEGGNYSFDPAYFESPKDAETLSIDKLSDKVVPNLAGLSEKEASKRIDLSSLDSRQADVVLAIPPGFREDLEAGRQPKLYVFSRPGEDRSRIGNNRLTAALGRWGTKLTEVRLARHGLPDTYNKAFAVNDPETDKSGSEKSTAELFDMLTKVFPIILVMWSLAGALYPAVDLCAGEKERGTMETLLISPASREEIVWGKFLTIWLFSAATALLNLLSMGLTTLLFCFMLDIGTFRFVAVLWGVPLLLPLSAFFSAVSLAIGAFARSSKEGQYYLMPLFLLTMPLIFLTLFVDKLDAFYSMVPITGIALLMQGLMGKADLRELSVYFVPVLGPMVIYSWLALRWAIGQFQREEVLFREAERLDLGLWVRSIFRDKEPLPTVGQAFFCFDLVLLLSCLSVGFGGRYLMAQLGVRYLAFVATPPLFMALLLTRRPGEALGLRRAPWWGWPAAAALAVLLFLPALEYTHLIVENVPNLKVTLEEYLRSRGTGLPATPGGTAEALRWQALTVAVLGSVCEELAFRGFILSGLRRRFKPLTAVLVSSLLFALSQMNVFQFIPHFVVGAAMGLLVIRTGSVVPAMVCHLVFNMLVYGPIVYPETFAYLGYANEVVNAGDTVLIALSAVSLLAAAWLAYVIWRGVPPAADDTMSLAPERPAPDALAGRSPARSGALQKLPANVRSEAPGDILP
jgi:sodium transport system permease protein